MTNFIYPGRVHVEDTVYGGVIYHANYLSYFERARSEWSDQLGFGINWQREQDVLFAVRSANISFLKPGRLHEWLEVTIAIREVRAASIIFHQQLRRKQSPDTILCKAEIEVVTIDSDFRPKRIPKSLAELLLNYSGE
jgi:acyl-CoA thioester hydrolase